MTTTKLNKEKLIKELKLTGIVQIENDDHQIDMILRDNGIILVMFNAQNFNSGKDFNKAFDVAEKLYLKHF